MPVDPQVQSVLDLAMAASLPPMSEVGPALARERFTTTTALIRKFGPPIEVGSVCETTIPTPDGELAARVYVPVGDAAPRPTIAFFHGGGFVIGDIESHDNQARRLCRDVGAVVISTDYRLAPEAPWPAGVEDAYAATKYIAENIADFGADPSRFVIGGDSAGGNFAAVVAQLCRDAGGPLIAAQLLLYPAIDFTATAEKYPSHEEFAEGYFLTRDDMLWFAESYLGGSSDIENPRLSPIYGDLEGLPPALVVTAEYDPLRDEGEAYAAALSDAGVRVSGLRFDGLIHGFFDLGAISPACEAAAEAVCTELANLLTEQDN